MGELRDRVGLVLVLELIQLPVDSLQMQQFLMRAGFPDTPTMKNYDAVGVLNRGEPVGDDDRGPACQEFFQRVPYQQFRFRVDARGRFIQHQYPGIEGQGAREREQLLLSYR